MIRTVTRMATRDMIRDYEKSRIAVRKSRKAFYRNRSRAKAREAQAFLTRMVWCDRCLTRVPGSALKRGKISGRLTCASRAACDQRRRR